MIILGQPTTVQEGSVPDLPPGGDHSVLRGLPGLPHRGRDVGHERDHPAAGPGKQE
mgnify:CR=1 FL=1